MGLVTRSNPRKMSSTKHILLWFEAPLQSWGADSRFGRRDTLAFPTKSAVTGLILAAVGASGPQEEILAELAPLSQTVISFKPSPRRAGGQSDRLLDFHMVGSGYNEADAWERMMVPKTSTRKRAVGGGSKITYRFYLQDARFAVLFEVPSNRVDELVQGLSAPVYDVFLGRKSCVPSDLVFRGTYTDLESGLTESERIAGAKNLDEAFRVVPGSHRGDTFAVRDVPVRFGPRKSYRQRVVTLVPS